MHVVGGGLADEGYGIQVGVILPLFSWLAKDEKVVEAKIKKERPMAKALRDSNAWLPFFSIFLQRQRQETRQITRHIQEDTKTKDQKAPRGSNA